MISTLRLDAITRLFSRSGNYFALIYFLCSSVGAFYSVFYLAKGMFGIACYEIATFICYLPVIYLARRDHWLTGPMAYVQFLHHQCFSTYLFGFDAGFWLLLCCMYFAHFIFFKHLWSQLAATVITTCVLFGAYFCDYFECSAVFAPGVFSDPAISEFAHDLFVINLVFAISSMISCGVIIQISSNGRIESLINQAYRDFLTGLHNRKYVLEYVWPKCAKEPLCLAIADLDDFKAINDTLGHEQGDVVLKFLAVLLQHQAAEFGALSVRLARWGGEEFLILAQTSDEAAFCKLLEAIRSELERSRIINRQISVSIGAVAAAERLGFDRAFEQADKNLYVAKRTGKNRVVI